MGGGRWEAGGGRREGGGGVRGGWELVRGGWELVGGGGGGRRAQQGREGLGGAIWCGPKFFGSVRYGSGRFDTILGESSEAPCLVGPAFPGLGVLGVFGLILRTGSRCILEGLVNDRAHSSTH